MVMVHIDIHDVLDDICDLDLIKELNKRGYHVLDEKPSEQPDRRTTRDLAQDAMHDLMARRSASALANIRKLVAAFVPIEVTLSFEYATAGNDAAAIFELDRFIVPSPAVSAEHIPLDQRARRPVHQSTGGDHDAEA